jgi:polygalacturonase
MKKLVIISFALFMSVSLLALKPLLDVSDPWKAMKEVEKEFVKLEFPEREFSIINYGAKDGVEVYTINAINSAINAASSMGGGTVIVPAGVWYTGPITLKSNINLHMEDGAVIKFSTTPEDYLPMVETRFEGWDVIGYRPLIYAYGEANIAITGKGILDGQANETNWWPWKGKTKYGYKKGMISQEWNGTKENGGRNRISRWEEENVPVKDRVLTKEDRIRPSFVELNNCKSILLEDFKLINSPFWCLHPLLSENIVVRGVTVQSHGPNNDGCDPESCELVLIEDCLFNTGDDCIAIKSGKNNDGRRWARPSKNIIIRNCIMKDGHGGVVLGSEISGKVKNVWVEDCEMDSPNLDRVIRIKSNPIRGGQLENFFIRNIKVGQCKEAIFRVEMKYEHVTEGPNMPLVKNFVMENITSEKSKYGIWIDGFENAPKKQVTGVTIKDCIFNNVVIPYKIVGAEKVTFDNVVINGEKVEYK